ncbi:nucleoside 2-deoxyribosyltransferase [Vibrio sp. DW001]|uniref:hypothetical protein n=1 Tax=Vibrio sp. DW001 TaxID=2912315 RepID=UPI0023AFB77C|nr:hypothetical protein [Vibrio sp. DW001]WED29900.1 nucleoside 2-deoxyribosyltransferase [Vibrio sp. DW001]
MEVSDLVFYITPIISLVIVAVLYFNTRMASMAKKYEDYKHDDFRKSIEKELYSLHKELSLNKDRFNSINHLVNDVKYSDAKKHHKNDDNGTKEFLQNLGVTSLPEVDPKKVFVLTPFNEEFSSQYNTIKETLNNLGLKCVRGDDSTVSSNILAHIMEEMLSAKVVVANLSGRNANVFYELGIAHALGKPVLLISESIADIPFDIQHQRILTFNNEEDLAKDINKWFISTLLNNKI